MKSTVRWSFRFIQPSSYQQTRQDCLIIRYSIKVENKKKNRYPDKLPYDHNRVLLNALVNGSNSDYINASSVMDHDPRNPTYIISQGPMTNTVADFWQMVWEQGSVVIVMLSKYVCPFVPIWIVLKYSPPPRLTENGYQLCHRYWPEEGSEQYHIFEVRVTSVLSHPRVKC